MNMAEHLVRTCRYKAMHPTAYKIKRDPNKKGFPPGGKSIIKAKVKRYGKSRPLI